MRRLSRSGIETTIAVTLATAPPLVRSRLRSKLTMNKDWARKELAKAIAAQLDNDNSMVVVVTALVHFDSYSVPGKWAADEAPPCWRSRRDPVAKSKISVANCKTPSSSSVIIASLDVAIDQWAGSHWKGTFVVGRIGGAPEHPVLPLARFRGSIVNLPESCYVQSTREGGHEHRG